MLVQPLSSLLELWGLPAATLVLWTTILATGLSLLLATVVYVVLSRVVIPIVLRFVNYTDAEWDDILFNAPLLRVVAELAFIIILQITLPSSLAAYPGMAGVASVVCRVGLVCVIIHLVTRFLNAVFDLMTAKSTGRVNSLKGILQMLQVIAVCIGIIIIISILADKNPVAIITGLGAAATVLMLVFKDSIMGVVAGVQLTLNDMLRPGDWITVPSRNINGTVVDVGLTTVKVQNFDNTIVTVPPYSLVSESFQNWRGMSDSGGRRLNRAVTIDVNSVGFATPEQIEAFRSEPWGTELDPSMKYVNLTLFRQYLEYYITTIQSIKNDSDDMIFMVRELAPTHQGIPVEVYFFTSLTSWKPFELLTAEVTDHIFASVHRFGLAVFQAPSGLDVRNRR